MTFSIVARCPDTGQVGVAAVTAMKGVGKLVAHARTEVGAAATQATINPYLAFDGLALMQRHQHAKAALDTALASDPGADFRQAALVDWDGCTAAWTGQHTPAWSGHLHGEDCCTQGNRLVGPETLEAVADAFARHADLDLAHRLLRAVEAGEATGADIEGAASATLTVYATELYPLWDVRVDAADDPVVELARLVGEFAEELVPQIKKLPTRSDPFGQMTRETAAGLD